MRTVSIIIVFCAGLLFDGFAQNDSLTNSSKYSVDFYLSSYNASLRYDLGSSTFLRFHFLYKPTFFYGTTIRKYRKTEERKSKEQGFNFGITPQYFIKIKDESIYKINIGAGPSFIWEELGLLEYDKEYLRRRIFRYGFVVTLMADFYITKNIFLFAANALELYYSDTFNYDGRVQGDVFSVELKNLQIGAGISF